MIRFNGMLGSQPNSHRQIGPELMRRFSRWLLGDIPELHSLPKEQEALLAEIRDRKGKGALASAGGNKDIFDAFINAHDPLIGASGAERVATPASPPYMIDLKEDREHFCTKLHRLFGNDLVLARITTSWTRMKVEKTSLLPACNPPGPLGSIFCFPPRGRTNAFPLYNPPR
jgi:hypothetical protein